jgi:hypothetical protein
MDAGLAQSPLLAPVLAPPHPTHSISVSIFNQANYSENRRFCGNPSLCFYKCSRPISANGPQKNIFVLECINDLNRIGGIGLIYCEFSRKTYKNHVDVYSDAKYSQFCFNYAGRFRVGREIMTERELAVLALIEDFCFRGKGHVKRTAGIGRFPLKHIRKIEEILQIDLVEWVRDLFRSRSWKPEVS